MRAHFERMLELYGPVVGTVLYRKWIPQYGRKLLRGRQHMVELLQLTDADAMRSAMESLTEGDDPGATVAAVLPGMVESCVRAWQSCTPARLWAETPTPMPP